MENTGVTGVMLLALSFLLARKSNYTAVRWKTDNRQPIQFQNEGHYPSTNSVHPRLPRTVYPVVPAGDATNMRPAAASKWVILARH